MQPTQRSECALVPCAERPTLGRTVPGTSSHRVPGARRRWCCPPASCEGRGIHTICRIYVIIRTINMGIKGACVGFAELNPSVKVNYSWLGTTYAKWKSLGKRLKFWCPHIDEPCATKGHPFNECKPPPHLSATLPWYTILYKNNKYIKQNKNNKDPMRKYNFIQYKYKNPNYKQFLRIFHSTRIY